MPNGPMDRVCRWTPILGLMMYCHDHTCRGSQAVKRAVEGGRRHCMVGLLTHGSSEGKESALAAGAMQWLVALLRGSCGAGSPHASRHGSGPASRSSGSDSSSGSGNNSQAVRGQALLGIHNLVVGSHDGAAALQAADGIGLVVQLLCSTPAASPLEQAAAAAILTRVPIGSNEPTAAAIAAGAFDALLPLLWSSTEEVRLQAAWTCRNLCWGTPTNVMAAADQLREAGCIAPLLRLVSDSSTAVQGHAAAALWNMASSGKRCAAALNEAGAAQKLVAFLHTCGSSDGAGADGANASDHSSSGGSSSDSKYDPDQREDIACTAALALADIVGCGGRAAADDAMSAAGGMQQQRELLQAHGGERALQKAAPGLPPDADDPQSPAADAGPATGGGGRQSGEQPGAEEGAQAAGMKVEQPEAPAAGSQPAAAAPACPPAPKVCAAEGCGTTSGLKRCGGCASVRYCSVACSRAHWPAHKAECRRLQAAAADGQAQDT